MQADILTKPLSGTLFKKIVCDILGITAKHPVTPQGCAEQAVPPEVRRVTDTQGSVDPNRVERCCTLADDGVLVNENNYAPLMEIEYENE